MLLFFLLLPESMLFTQHRQKTTEQREGVNPGLTFSKTRGHRGTSGEIPLISASSVRRRVEQMGEHTAQGAQVEGSNGTELTWRKTSKENALGAHPVLSACMPCLHV